jgi:hypothetical protein
MWMPFYKVLLYLHSINSYEGHNTRWKHNETSNKVDEELLNSFLEEL